MFFFFEHFPAYLPPPLFTIPFPDGIGPERIGRNTMSSWNFCSSHSLYFNMMCQKSKLHRFQMILEPDLSTASLNVRNTHEPVPHDIYCYVFFHDYRICEDTFDFRWFTQVRPLALPTLSRPAVLHPRCCCPTLAINTSFSRAHHDDPVDLYVWIKPIV